MTDRVPTSLPLDALLDLAAARMSALVEMGEAALLLAAEDCACPPCRGLDDSRRPAGAE